MIRGQAFLWWVPLLALAMPAMAAASASPLKKTPLNHAMPHATGKKTSFSVPARTHAPATVQQKTSGIKARRDDSNGTLLNHYPRRKDGWGHALPSPHEEAQDFLVRRNSRAISR